MIHPCRQCGQSLKVSSPGAYQCPKCGALMKIEPEEFAWEAGGHLNDFGAPASEDTENNPGDHRTGEKNPSEAASTGIPVAAVISPGDAPTKSSAEDQCEICAVREASRACRSCGKLVCTNCSTLDSSALPICAACRPVPISGQNSFENAGRLGFLKSIPGTVISLIFHPFDFFSRLPTPGPFWPGILFGILICYPFRVIAVFILAYSMQGQIADIESQLGIVMPVFITDMMSQPSFIISMLISGVIFQPIFIMLSILFTGTIIHPLLLFMGKLHGRYEDSIRVAGYAKLGEILTIIPLIGPFIAIAWTVVLMAIGFHKVHRIPLWKASLAAAAPVLICGCGLLAVFAAAFAFVLPQISF
jgi:hypothetical protein